MSDQITTLWSQGLAMTKTWHADGTILPYANAKHFSAERHSVANINELSNLLVWLEREPNACIIRGQPTADAPTTLRRLRENFDDLPLHTILIEIDQYQPLLSEPLDGEGATLEYIVECLPEVFHGVSFHWTLSASAGAPGKEGQLRAHCWFYLDTPYDSATLKAWAKNERLQLDHSVFQTVQPHFTAAPIFEDGVKDPVPRRSGLWRGERDTVPLAIDTERLDIKVRGARQRGDSLDITDPVAEWVSENWETWGTLSNGGLLVSCPWDSDHSGGAKGDTSSAFFPAGSNGYKDGAFVCLHSSCDGRHKSDFLHAIGYTDSKFDSLVEQPAKVNGTHLNGHVIVDPLILPPFKRNGSGKIETCLINVAAALTSPRVSHLAIRYDLFKDAVVCSEHDTERWRPFRDVDYTKLRVAMEEVGLKQVGREMIRDGVHMVAQEHAFDTAIDWLESLTWDGIPRVETFWVDHFGVKDDTSGYARAVARYTWSALAGRVMCPGVQADMVPILTGKQGARKSTGVEALAPTPEFFTNMSFHEPDVERARKMRGKVVVELGELQGLKSRDSEEILAWVTRKEEHWTPKFMEMTTNYKRRFLMIATTNQDDFLDNPDGERRWLPLAIGRAEGFRQVDTARLTAVRDQLWAEGREMFLSDGIAWQDAERLARAQHGQWKADDGWRAAIVRWLDAPEMGGTTPRDRPHITLLDVCEGALAMPARTMKWGDQRRIAKVLRDEGYEPTQRRIGNKPFKVWVAPDYV